MTADEAGTASGGASIPADELRQKGREVLRQAEKALQEAEAARAEAAQLAQTAKDLQQRIFQTQLLARQLEASGDDDAAREQRKLGESLRREANEQFHSADQKGEEAASLERKVYKLRSIAQGLAEQIRELAS